MCDLGSTPMLPHWGEGLFLKFMSSPCDSHAKIQEWRSLWDMEPTPRQHHLSSHLSLRTEVTISNKEGFCGDILRAHHKKELFCTEPKENPCISKVWIGFFFSSVCSMSWIRERVKRRDLFSPFQSQVLLGLHKVAGKADSLGQEQAFWTNLWFQPSDTHQIRQFPSTVHPEDQRYSSPACANPDMLTEQFAALGISRHFGCPLSWPTIVTRPTQEVQVTSGFLRNWVYM